MKKRILAIICIMFLLFTATSPLSGGVFSYADEPQQESLSTDEIIVAGLTTYLNDRKAWIVNQSGDDVGTVYAVMRDYINAFEYWSSDPTFTKAKWVASILVKYSPFRISLKGSAVRAYNDLYDWLVSSGKLDNLDDSSGGETTDNLYNGAVYGNELFYYVNQNYSSNSVIVVDDEYVNAGSPVQGWTADNIVDYYKNHQTNNIDILFDPSLGVRGGNTGSDVTLNIQYYNNVSATYYLKYDRDTNYSSSIQLTGFAPYLKNWTGSNLNAIKAGTTKSAIGYGVPCRIGFQNNFSQTSYYGNVYYEPSNGKYYFLIRGQLSRNDTPNVNSASVNFDTDNFDKTNPIPPEGDNEIEYTPEDKTTGNTYNTYNEYISNYVRKNTVINNNSGGGTDPNPDPDPSPGGTTPPWTGGNSGTLIPDGNGGFDLSLPDLTLPDLNIDWSINGLKDKFPFSIPWDLMAFFTVLNAEPETPSIEAQIDLGIVNWDIDWDFHSFDTLAALLRNIEFIGFCLALLLITRSIIKG